METFKIVIVLFCASLILSCTNNESNTVESENEKLEILVYNENSNTEISFNDNELTINFKSTINQNRILSEVKIFDNISKKNTHSNIFTIDKNKDSYKLGVFRDIENTSIDLKDKLKYNQWIRLRNLYENFLKSLTKMIGIEKYQSDLIQSTFYHLSIYNTIIRSFDTGEDCECTPLTAYFVEKSSFWCQEDYFFDVKEMLDYYTKNKEFLFSLEGGEKEYNYIKSLRDKKDYVSHKDLFKLHHSVKEYKAAAKIEFERVQNDSNYLKKGKGINACWWGLGYDLGCCGNYSGCCWYASLDCFRHDVACLRCDKWHCGPSCESEGEETKELDELQE